MKRGDLILAAGGAVVGLVAAWWIYEEGYRAGVEHGRTTERVQYEVEREVERQLRESARRLNRGGR